MVNKNVTIYEKSSYQYNMVTILDKKHQHIGVFVQYRKVIGTEDLQLSSLPIGFAGANYQICAATLFLLRHLFGDALQDFFP